MYFDSNFMKRIAFLVWGTTIVQIFIYTMLFGIVLCIEKCVDCAFLLLYSVLFFSVIVFLLNLFTAVINRRWFINTAIFLASTFYVIGWGEDFSTHPYRTSFLILSGITSILYKLPMDKYFRKKQQEQHTKRNGILSM